MSSLTRILRDRKRKIDDLQNNPYKYYGYFRGYIVDIPRESDSEFTEEQRSKVKVRIPAIHQDKSITPDSDLPWAEILSLGGGTNDCGSYEPSYIGSKVLIAFEQGHPRFPLVVATWNAQPQNSGKIEVAGDEVEVPSGIELPKEVAGIDDTKVIFHKTFKGHTVYCEEKSGEEFLRVIDRAGNIIELKGPVADPTRRRGVGNAVDGGEIPARELSGEAHILIKDVAGQEIKMVTSSTAPEIIMTTTGTIKLGGPMATLTFALARLLYNSLRTVIIPLRTHSHITGKEGSPTGTPIQTIPDLPDPAAWDTPRIFGDQT